jgi:alpha-L-rhamnosidase
MTTGPDGGTLWEKETTTGALGSGSTSLAHGWSTGPTSALTAYVLGVTPASPGYATWRVDPQPGSLSWAEGAVPTPRGDITVKWASGAGGFRIAITAPPRTRGTIVLPAGVSRCAVTVNGRPLQVKAGQAVLTVQ